MCETNCNWFDVCMLHKSLPLVRYLWLPHPPDSGGGEDRAGDRLQEAGGRDAGDRVGTAVWGGGSSSPLDRVRATTRNTRRPGGLRPLAHRERLPPSQPLVRVHAAVRGGLDG